MIGGKEGHTNIQIRGSNLGPCGAGVRDLTNYANNAALRLVL